MTRELLSEVLDVYVYELDFIQDNRQFFKFTSIEGSEDYQVDNINIHELAFDKCIEWLWKQGFDLWSFRANNIFHVRISNKDIKEKRFYSNPDDKYEAVFQACEWVLKRRGNTSKGKQNE